MNAQQTDKAVEFFGLFLCIGGYLLVFMNDWRIGLGLFLIHWSINIDRKARS